MAAEGGDPAETGCAQANADGGDGGAPAKKPAWRTMENGATGVAPLIVGEDSWPELSTATGGTSRRSRKQVAASSAASNLPHQGSVIAASLPKSVDNHHHANANSKKNYKSTFRRKSKQSDRGTENVDNVISSPRAEKQIDSTKEEPLSNGILFREVYQSHSADRRVNNMPHLHGGGGHYKNDYCGNHYDRGPPSHEYKHPRYFSERNVHLQQQQPRPVGSNLMRPPGARPPFVASSGYVMNPYGLPGMTRPIYYGPPLPPVALCGSSFLSRPSRPVIFSPAPDPGLKNRLIEQIEYYFSIDNLIKDLFLRSNMDEEGWIPISLIAGFSKVKEITTNIRFMLEVLRASTEVEVQGDRVRKRYDWKDWPVSPNVIPPALGSKSPAASNDDRLVNEFNDLAVSGTEDITKTRGGGLKAATAGELLSRTSSGESSFSIPSNEGVVRFSSYQPTKLSFGEARFFEI